MNSLTDTDKPKAYSINNTMTLKGNRDLEKHSGMGSVIIGVKLKWQKALWNNRVKCSPEVLRESMEQLADHQG